MQGSMRTLISLLTLSAGLSAQSPEPARAGQWIGPSRLLVKGEGPEVPSHIEEGPGKILERLPRQQGDLHLDFHEGHFWSSRAGKATFPDGSEARQSTLFKLIDGRWERQVDFRYRHGLIWEILPLGNGKYLGISGQPNFQDGSGKQFPFAVLRADAKGNLEVASTQDAGLAGPYFQKSPAHPNSETPYGSLELDFLSPTVIRTEGFITVLSPRTGWFWVFSDMNGQLKRQGQIYASVGEELLKKSRDLAHVCLGAQPRPDGRILIATRSEDAVQQAARAFQKFLPKTDSDSAFISNYGSIKDLWDLNLQSFPRVEWWKLDPATGSIEPEAAPQRFPSLVRSVKELKAFRWRFNSDGNLMWLGAFLENIEERTPTKAKKAK
ncbi:MAG: hypothetical protein IPL96_09285 [Holophagaceae bacterium]|nr:hypothetical protein [Holophagaceae bacterium]